MGTKQSSLSSADEQESTTWLKTKHGAQFTFTKEGFLLVKRPYRKGKKEKRKADLDFRTEARKMAQKQGFTKMSKEAKQSFNIPNNVYAFADAWWEKQLKSTCLKQTLKSKHLRRYLLQYASTKQKPKMRMCALFAATILNSTIMP